MQGKLTRDTNVVRPPSRIRHVRHIVLAAICLLYLISYVDRVTISVAAPKIVKEFHFTPTEMGFIFSAFSFAYSLLPIFVGTFGDRLGPRRVLSLLMAWWSIFTTLTGVVTSFISFFIVRLLFGLGESGSFPVATRALASWYPPSARGFLQGVTHAASRIGAAISAPIIVAIVVLFGGWRWSFYLLGIVGIIWAILFYFFFRDKPTEVAAVSESEIALINEGRTGNTDSSQTNPPVPWRKLLRGKDIWILSIIQFIYGYTFWIYLTWLPTYLTDSRHFTFLQLGIVASLPLLGGVLGDVLGGWLSDLLYKRTGNLNLARRLMILISFLGAVAFTIPALLVQNAVLAEVLIIGTMFMLECSVSSTWAVAMDLGGEYYSGTTSGFVSTAFGIAGIVAPILFGVQKQLTGTFIPGFFTGSILLIIGAFIVFLINANNILIPNKEILKYSDEEADEPKETVQTGTDEKKDESDSIDQPAKVDETNHADEPVASADEIKQTAEAASESVEKVGETDVAVLVQAEEVAQGDNETHLAGTNTPGETEEAKKPVNADASSQALETSEVSTSDEPEQANGEAILATSAPIETLKEVDDNDGPEHTDEAHTLDQPGQPDAANKVDGIAITDVTNEVGSTNHTDEAHEFAEPAVIDIANAPAGSEATAPSNNLADSPAIEEPTTINTPPAIETTEAVENQAVKTDTPAVNEENHQTEATSTPVKPKTKRTRQVKSKVDKAATVDVNAEENQAEASSIPAKPARRPSQKRSTKSRTTQ